MNENIIIDTLLEQQPNERLAFLPNVDIDAIGRQICAFLNNLGGDILIGISDKKQIRGLIVEDIHMISKELRDSIVPLAPFSIKPLDYKDKYLLLINVWPGASKPYSYNGIIYIQEGALAVQANGERLALLNSERRTSEFHWERQTVLGAEIEDLDFRQLKTTISAYRKERPELELDTEEFLSQLGLLRGGSLTNAAIVLFAENPIRFLPQCKLRITVYEGFKSGNTLLFDKLFEGNLFKNLDSAWEFFTTYLIGPSKIEGLHRMNRNFPELALREGLMNALVHRDYSRISGNLVIELFNDRMEITNSGELPGKLEVSDLRKEHPSLLRNPDIAKICFIRGYIEMLGTGTLRLINDCEINGFPEPVWISENGFTKLIFKGISHQLHLGLITESGKKVIDGAIDGTVDGTVDGTTDGTVDGTIDGTVDGNITLQQNIKKIVEEIAIGATEQRKSKLSTLLKAIAENQGKRLPEYEKTTGLAPSSIERYIRTLRENGLIEFFGDALHVGGYQLTEQAKKKLGL